MGDRTSAEIGAYVRNQGKKKAGTKQLTIADFLDWREVCEFILDIWTFSQKFTKVNFLI